MGVQRQRLVGVVVSWVLLWRAGAAVCPWEAEGLSKWSEDSTWGDAGVPTEGSEVVIPTHTRVLLDVQPAKLATLTIEPGAALVWGAVDGLTLDTHYVWIKGEFLLGNQSCRFPYTAHIRLHGHPNDDYYVEEHEFKRKFLGVAPGGTLEIHGKRKTSWTKLAQTIKPITQVACAKVYDHNNFTQNLARIEKQVGLNVLVLNEDGSFMDFGLFKDTMYEVAFRDFVNGIREGKVVAIMAYGDGGIETKSQGLEDAVVSLGGKLITSTQSQDSYVFLGKKGSPTTIQELTNGDKEVTDFLTYHDEDAGLLFQVAVNDVTVKALQMFRVIKADAAFPKLTLADEVSGWREDDEVVVTSTDYDHKQSEVRKIIKCQDCTARQIRVNATFDYMHYGNFTNYVDERAEVAMLSRTIVIEGVLADECYDEGATEDLCAKFNRDTFGGHLMVVRGFKDVHVRGVQLYHMGQQWNKGAYPLHFHMVDSAKGAYLRENTVLDSFSRCVAIHGTDSLEVADNVCYKHLGHGVFLEDSVEQHNKITGNLVAGTTHGTLLLTDRHKDWCSTDMREYCDALSSFWLTHPNNDISGNVAAGGEGIGYMYTFADMPLGPSRDRQLKELKRPHNPKNFPMHFTRNVAHSNGKAGVWMDEKISTGTGYENKGNVTENGILRTESEYDPRQNGNGKPVWTEMSYGTFYKNRQLNMWVKGGNVRVSFSTIADSREGFSGGTTLFNSGTEVYKCIFIGETDNKGNPWNSDPLGRTYGTSPKFSLTAVGLYQGPVFVNSCFFDNYDTVQWCQDSDTSLEDCSSSDVFTRNAGAISFKRSNTYPTMTSSYAVNNTFGFCDNTTGRHWVWQGPNSLEDWIWKDGNRNVFLRDKDGHLTGTVNASIVNNVPLFSGDECQLRADWGDMLACPYRYVKMEVLGSGGNLDRDLKNQYPLVMERDDFPYNKSFLHQGEIRNEWLLRTNRSYILNVNKTLKGAAFSDVYKIFGYGVEKGDVVRVGLCQPKDVKKEDYEITMDYPVVIQNDPVWVDSLQELDDDTKGSAFYLDTTNGILFFKMLSFHQDTNDTQQCPDGHCWNVKIVVNGGTKDNLRTCRSRDIDSYVGSLPVAKMPTTPECPEPTTPEGLGSVDWNNVFIEHEEYTVPCSVSNHDNTRTEPSYVGCYNERGQEMKSKEVVFLTQSMTVDFCTTRCYHRGYQYAALSRGTRCTCGGPNDLLTSADFVADDSLCTESCRGNSVQQCGGASEIAAWTTGIPASS